MKLNKAYYISKVDELICAIDWRCDEPNEKKFEAIVRRIALDAAEAQKVADITILKKMPEHQLAILEKMINRNAAIFAIESATVEVPEC